MTPEGSISFRDIHFHRTQESVVLITPTPGVLNPAHVDVPVTEQLWAMLHCKFHQLPELRTSVVVSNSPNWCAIVSDEGMK